jgi:hypothetical protein
VSALKVAIVSSDAAVRLAAARAFDAAPASWIIELARETPSDSDVVLYGPDVVAHDGISFDPNDPDGAVAAVEARARAGGLVVVTAANGGAGATTVALHLAARFARSQKTCVIDMDVGGATAVRLGLDDGSCKTWRDFDGTPESLMLCALPVRWGFRIALAPDETTATSVPELVRVARSTFDRVIVDVPARVHMRDFAGEVGTGVLVMNPTIPSARRARSIVRGYPSVRWALVSNRTGPGGETTRSELEALVERRVGLELSCCPALRDAEGEGGLLASRWHRWSLSLERLERALS